MTWTGDGQSEMFSLSEVICGMNPLLDMNATREEPISVISLRQITGSGHIRLLKRHAIYEILKYFSALWWRGPRGSVQVHQMIKIFPLLTENEFNLL